jgi:hypothetical protein
MSRFSGLASGVRGSTFSKEKGPKGLSNNRVPTAQGRFMQRMDAQDILDDVKRGDGRAVSVGGKPRRGGLPRTNRRGVTNVNRGNASQRMAASVLRGNMRRRKAAQARRADPGGAVNWAARQARRKRVAQNEVARGRLPGAGRGLAGVAAAPLAYGIAGAIKTKSTKGFLKGLNTYGKALNPTPPHKNV